MNRLRTALHLHPRRRSALASRATAPLGSAVDSPLALQPRVR